MAQKWCFYALLSAQLLFSVVANSQPLQAVKPEDVGISSAKVALLKQELNDRVSKGELPGAVVMVVRNQKIAMYEAIGFRDMLDQSPMQKDSIFRIASMTKPIISVAVLQLKEQGKLSLEDPVSKYLPEFTNVKVGVEKTNDQGQKELVLESPQKKMTLQDLLRHTSGLTYGWDKKSMVDKLYEENQLFNAELTLEEQIKKLATLPLKFQPGTTWEYSVSTDVLGRVLEVVSGKPLDIHLREAIFEPLQMLDTQFGSDASNLKRMAEAQINPKTDKRYLTLSSGQRPKRFSGGGGLSSTAMDYAKFCQMILNHGEFSGKTILSRKSIELMTANHLPSNTYFPPSYLNEWGSMAPIPEVFGTGFGLGFAVRLESGKNPMLGSVGDLFWMGSSGTSFVIDPKEKLILIMFTQQPNLVFQYHRLLRHMGYAMLKN
jgi:CubicO group peptidase (beta-lactamase class C family)